MAFGVAARKLDGYFFVRLNVSKESMADTPGFGLALTAEVFELHNTPPNKTSSGPFRNPSSRPADPLSADGVMRIFIGFTPQSVVTPSARYRKYTLCWVQMQYLCIRYQHIGINPQTVRE
jgi:hypothetical protein